ncbi:putative protein GREB1-like [Apostichopus japonicus]|uniref:GREB1 N-terminal domain-containing protein n=1 Tax=Stichopus japonicus TaxID=307972 RepID=A0A2G8KJQ0_STIJA|nr:putative protein GREB1-like [Apostichopus japonicus]
MGNSQGQLKSSKFETALHMSIEQALRSNSTTPHPLFSQLYLEKDLKLSIPDVLPTSSDGGFSVEKPTSQSPKGKADKENNEPTHHSNGGGKCSPSDVTKVRLVSSLPPVAAPISVVHAPPALQGVMLSPRLPPSPLGPSYLPQRFLLPGQYPPHALPPMLHQVQTPPPPRQVERRVTSSPGCHRNQVSPSSAPHRDNTGSEAKQKSDAEPHSYLMKPLVVGGCQEVGFCQAGADIRLTEISAKSIEVQNCFTLVGAKSPYLPENILVAAVDLRYLPDPSNYQALLGFSGYCVGCGEKGFRYFTEFAHHINLKVLSQAKKQKHLKYYIVANKKGHWIRGPLIPWKELKRSSEEDGNSSDDLEEKEAVEAPSHLTMHSVTPPPGLLLTPVSRSHTYSESAPSTRTNSLKLKVEVEGKEETLPDSHGGTMTSETRDLKQPPKKRHRFHSVDEDALRKSAEPPVAAKRMVPPPVFPLPRFLPPPSPPVPKIVRLYHQI